VRIRSALSVAIALLLPTVSVAQPATATVDVCFVPAERCADRIIWAIDGATTAIRVEAYGFSSRPILEALLRAHARGVDVAVLLDRSDERGRRIGLSAMEAGGIPTWIDRVSGIAHIKAIVW
jgi:phospholipase D